MQLIARSLLAAVCHACLLLTLVFYLPGTSKKTVAAETHRTNVVVLNGSESDQNLEGHIPVSDNEKELSCVYHPFPELCNHELVFNNFWILHLPQSGCNITYTPIISANSNVQQTISISNCQTIYSCWLVFEDAAVCVYYHLANKEATPNEQLYLALMVVRQGKWVLVQSQSVFVFRQYSGTISSSVALYGIMDIESDSEAAVFLIGKGRDLYRVELLLMGPPARRPTTVCEQHHQIIRVSANNHDVLVICDNQVYWIEIGVWEPVEVTPQELAQLTFSGLLVKSFISESHETSVGLTAVNITGDLRYCFIVPHISTSKHPLNYCGIIHDASLTRGTLITRNNIYDTQFLALLDGTVLVLINISSNDSFMTINSGFCYPQDNCYLVQTMCAIYVGNQEKTMALDRNTFEIITTQNASMDDVLPMVEDKCKALPSPSPTWTTTPMTNTIVSNSSTILTPTGVTNASITVPSPPSSSATISVDAITVTNTAKSEPSKTSIAVEPSSISITPIPSKSANVSDTGNVQSESSALVVILTTALAIFVIIFLLLVTFISLRLGRRCCSTRNHPLKLDLQSILRRRTKDTLRPASDDHGKAESELVIPPNGKRIYLPTEKKVLVDNSDQPRKEKLVSK